MKPAPFRYERPVSIEAALALLAEHGGDAKILAGGQSLVPLLNMRLARPAVLIDINRIHGLDSLRSENGHLVIGATVRDRDAELSAEVGARCPLFVAALGHVGHVEIRNQGTVCGSLAHADPVAELPLVAVALDAELIVASIRDQRRVSAADFFLSYLTTALAEDELLTEVRVPAQQSHSGWSFLEFARRRGDYALVAVAALIESNPDGTCRAARLVLGGVDATPHRAIAAEQALISQPLTADTFAAAGQTAAAALDPPTDVQASGAYRRKLAAVLVERALVQAAARVLKE